MIIILVHLTKLYTYINLHNKRQGHQGRFIIYQYHIFNLSSDMEIVVIEISQIYNNKNQFLRFYHNTNFKSIL